MNEEYKKYQHVEKFGSAEVEGIEFGLCYVFPKIDGTNAHVWYDDAGFHVGSRRREISVESDNHGFAEWAEANEPLRNLALELKGYHIYGEWLVPHSLKTYRNDAWRDFYIFDIVAEDGLHLPFDEYEPILKRYDPVNYLAPIRILKNPKLEDIEKCLTENTFLIEDGKGHGEGVVVKNYDFVNKFGRQVWAKMVTSEFKEKHHKEMGAPISSCSAYVEEKMVDKYLTPDIVEKILAKIVADEAGWSSRFIPRLLNTAYYDFVRECMWDAVKDHKNPKVDFKILNRFCAQKVKQLKPELF